MRCRRCQGERLITAGFDRSARQVSRCSSCGSRQTCRSLSAFSGYRFPDEIIALAVRWYLRFRVPSADVAELLAERGIHVDPSTIVDWVQHVPPLSQEAARPHRHRLGCRWSVDETSLRMTGTWVSAYRAMDGYGQVIDVDVSETRDTVAATPFVRRALECSEGRPETVTTDKAPPYPAAFSTVLPQTEHRTGKLEQQGIERDHQHLTGRIRSMRGFPSVSWCQVIGAGHDLMRNLANGFSRVSLPAGDPWTLRAPRLVRAWEQVTAYLAGA